MPYYTVIEVADGGGLVFTGRIWEDENGQEVMVDENGIPIAEGG